MSSSSSSPEDELRRAHTRVWNIFFTYAKYMVLKCTPASSNSASPTSSTPTAPPTPYFLLCSRRPTLCSTVENRGPRSCHAPPRALRLLRPNPRIRRSHSHLRRSAREGETGVLMQAGALRAPPDSIVSQSHATADAAPTSFEKFHGKSMFGLAAEDAEINRLFNEGMAADAGAVAKVLVGDRGRHLFHGLRSLGDVGGGIGDFTLAIPSAFPQMKCVVFDLPHVVAASELGTKATTVEAVAGDMFESIPPAQAVLLEWILHDWNDEDCVMILRNCKAAIPPRDEGEKALIMDIVMKSEVETQLLFDVHMLGVEEGKQRTESEWPGKHFHGG